MRKCRLQRDIGIRIDRVVRREVGLIEPRKLLLHIHIAVQDDVGIGRMIVARMEGTELLEAELRNHRRITTGLVAVAGIREECVHDVALEHRLRIREDTLHLVVDDAVIAERILLVHHLIVPALLPEDTRILDAVRMEHGIEIDIHQVIEILLVAGRHRIHGLIRIGHRVQEGVEGALCKLHKRVLQRKLLRPAQHGVLRDVGHAGAVLRRGAEGDTEDLIVIRVLHGKDAGTALRMTVDARIGRKFIDSSGLDQLIILHSASSFFYIFPIRRSLKTAMASRTLRWTSISSLVSVAIGQTSG